MSELTIAQALELIQKDPYAYPKLPKRLRVNPVVFREVIKSLNYMERVKILVDKECVMYLIAYSGANIYKDLPKKLRKDPEILQTAIFHTGKGIGNINPVEYALPEALSYENVALIARKKLFYDKNLSEEACLRIVKELRKNPKKLRILLEKNYNYTIHEYILSRIFSNGITNEDIDWLVSNNIFPETREFLDNKYYILQAFEKCPWVLNRLGKDMKKDPEIYRLSLIYEYKFLKILEFESIQQFLIEYGNKYNMKNCTVRDLIRDPEFIKRVLCDHPMVYTLLSDEHKKSEENIRAVLEANGAYIIIIPGSYITEDLLSFAKSSYSELFEMLNDSSKILDLIDWMYQHESIFIYIFKIFTLDSTLLDKVVNILKNNDEASKKMGDLIEMKEEIFTIFLDMVSDPRAKENFEGLMKKNPPCSKNVGGDSDSLGSGTIGVCKFTRCVVGIDATGKRYEIDLDNSGRHHSDATYEIGIRTGCSVKEPSAEPFIIGQEVAQQGTIIIQIYVDDMIVYLPESISQEQYIEINNFLNSCKEIEEIAFTHNDELYEAPKSDITIDTLIQFCSQIIKNLGLNKT